MILFIRAPMLYKLTGQIQIGKMPGLSIGVCEHRYRGQSLEVQRECVGLFGKTYIPVQRIQVVGHGLQVSMYGECSAGQLLGGLNYVVSLEVRFW